MKEEKEYSVGLVHAWNIEAAGVAGEDNHKFIQKDHIFIGICRLLEENPASYREKYELTSQKEKLLRAEVKVIKNLLGEFKLDSAKLRDRVHKMLGSGNYQHKVDTNDKIKISRDRVCKNVFSRAEGLASSEVNCLHFLAALLDEQDSKTVHALNEKRVNLKDLKKCTIDRANSIEENKPPEEIIIIGTGGTIRSLMLPLKEKRKTLPEKLDSVENWLKVMLYVWHMVAYFIIGVVGIGKGVWDFLRGVWIGKPIKELIGHVIWDVIFSVLIVLALTTFIVIFILVERFIRPKLSKPS